MANRTVVYESAITKLRRARMCQSLGQYKMARRYFMQLAIYFRGTAKGLEYHNQAINCAEMERVK
jgi:hypothetical protein